MSYIVICADRDLHRGEILFRTDNLEAAKADARQRKALGEGDTFVVMQSVWTTEDKPAPPNRMPTRPMRNMRGGQ